MFFFLSKILDVFLSPFTWGLVCLALAVPWRRPRGGHRQLRRRWRRRRAFGLAGLAIFVVFGIEPVSNAMLYRLEHAAPSTFREDVVYDAVILLGGVSDEYIVAATGQPSYNDNVERLIATHRLLADGRARFAIVSGAAVDPALASVGEARVLARQIVSWGIEPSRVIVEEQARNTHENALYSRAIAEERGFRDVLVVTSAFHMRRAAECFEAVGMKVDTLAVDYRAYGDSGPRSSLLPRAGILATSTMTLREHFGLYVYRARGYAKPRP